MKNRKLIWVASVLAPIFIKLIFSRFINEIVGSFLLIREGISDLVELNRRFGESGLGIMSTGISCLILSLFFYKSIKNDVAKENCGQYYGLHKIDSKNLLLVILSASVLAILVNIIINALLANTVFDDYASKEKILFSGLFSMRLLVLGMLVPICEELLFRGLVFERVTILFSPKVAIVITAFLFGLYHLSIIQFVYATIMGFFMGYVYERNKNLLAPIIFHATANIVVLIAELQVK